MTRLKAFFMFCIFFIGGGQLTYAQETETLIDAYALAEFGTPKYQGSFEHFEYVNPDAPKKGTVRQGVFGHFDSLNYIILRGKVHTELSKLLYDPLMAQSEDELSVVYPLIAEKISYPEDLSYAIFTLNPKAQWHDGQAITAEDVVWTYQTIMNYGQPFLKANLKETVRVEALDAQKVKFSFSTKNNRKALINAANLRPLPKHYWEDQGRDISQTTLEPPLGSGPYYIQRVDEGKSIYYKRVQDYWALDLPVRKGLYNFELLRYDWYRDTTIMLEAFFANSLDFIQEYSSKNWATSYLSRSQVASGQVIRKALPDHRPQGMQGFFLNHRKPPLNNKLVRQAMIELMDFEWMQRNLMYGQYRRTQSWFPNSDFGQAGLPPSEKEKVLLKPWQDKLPKGLFEEAWVAPKTSGNGDIRRQIRKARKLLLQAGYEHKNGQLVDKVTQEPLTVEFLLNWQSMARLVQPYARNLEKAGFTVSIRVVDSAQYQKRLDQLDFDIVSIRLNFFPPPGPELRSYFGSKEADLEGTANYAGIKDPIVDALIEKIIEAETLEDLKMASRALDRVLLWGAHVIPHWHSSLHRIAWWNKYGQPEIQPYYSSGFPQTWWLDLDRLEAVSEQK